MNDEKFQKRLEELRTNHPNAFDGEYEVINESEAGEPVLEQLEEIPTEKVAHIED